MTEEQRHAHIRNAETTLCPVCGRALPPWVRGRPRVYCDDVCKRSAYWLDTAEHMIEVLAARCEPERWAAIRSRLWGALNGRAWNRGVGRVEGRPVAPWGEAK